MANGKTGRNDAFRRRSRSDRNLRDAIDDAIADAMRDDTGRAMSDSDRDLVNEMIGRKERLAMSMMGGAAGAGATLSDADRQRAMDRAGRLVADEFKELGMPTVKPRIRPERMEEGGLAGGQKKLDKNEDGKLTKEDFKILRKEKKNTKVQKLIGGGEVCRGGGAALRGTKFSGVK